MRLFCNRHTGIGRREGGMKTGERRDEGGEE